VPRELAQTAGRFGTGRLRAGGNDRPPRLDMRVRRRNELRQQ